MNKVYKLVWSKVRNCYVAVSEMAKSRTKAPGQNGIARTVVVGILACVLSCGITALVSAANFDTVVGDDASVSKDGAYGFGTAVGYSAKAGVRGSSFGLWSETGWYSAAFGGSTKAKVQGGAAFGSVSKILNNFGSTLGTYATVSGGEYGTAIGYTSGVSGVNSVALGAGSFANEKDVVSIGYLYNDAYSNFRSNNFHGEYDASDNFPNPNAYFNTLDNKVYSTKPSNVLSSNLKSIYVRRISYVADGVNSYDAATVAQTSTTSAGDGITVSTATNTNGSTKYTIAGKAATSSTLGMVKVGSNITNSSGMLSLTKANVVAALGYTPPTADTNTTYAAMTAAEATAGTATAARSITPKVLGDYVKSQTNNKITNLTVSGKTITFTKGDGSTGTITTQDTNTTYSNFKGATASTAGTAGLVPAPAAGKQTAFLRGDGTWATVPVGNVGEIKAGSGITVLKYDIGDGTSGYDIHASVDGAVLPDNAKAVSGATMYSELHPSQDGVFVKRDTRVALNLLALDDAYKNMIHNLSVNNDQIVYTKGDGSTGSLTVPGGKTYKAGTGLELVSDTFNVKADGNVVSGDTGVVTGGKVYDAITRMIQYDEGTNDTATLVGNSGTKLTNLKAGTLSKTSTDAVSGSQLYATNQNIAGFASDIKKNKDNITSLNASVTAALETVSVTSTLVNTIDNLKADASLNNLTTAGHQVITNAAANAVQEYMAKHHGGTGTDSNVNTSLRTVNSLNRSVDPVSMSLMSVNPAPADTNYVVYDDAQASQVTLEGPMGIGTKITNVAAGDLSAASTDAVNGAQLYEVTQHFDDFQSALSSNNTSIATAQTDINKMKTTHIQLESDVNTLKMEMETGFNVTVDGAKVKTVNPSDNYVDFVAGDGIKIEDANGSVKFSVDAKALGGVTKEDLDKKADLAYVDEQLGLKADVNSVYTKTEADGLLAGKADVSYVDSEIGSVRIALDGKADKDSVYTRTETDGLIAGKADKTYVDDSLALKADRASVYTKTEADDLFVGKSEMKDALDKKADVDAGNVDVSAWSDKLGIGTVEEGNTGLVNGGAVYDAIQKVGGTDMIAADYNSGSVRIAGNGKYDAFDVVDISKSDGSGRVLTGVVTNPEDKTSAANVGYVEAVGQSIATSVNDSFARMDNKVNKVGANAAALAALTPASFEGDEKWSLAASVGNYRNATAGAIGAFYRPQENVMVNVRGSFGNNENMIAGGVAVALNKGDVPGVTKRQLANAVNAQAAKIQDMEAAHAAEIAELKAQMAEMAELLKKKTSN